MFGNGKPGNIVGAHSDAPFFNWMGSHLGFDMFAVGELPSHRVPIPECSAPAERIEGTGGVATHRLLCYGDVKAIANKERFGYIDRNETGYTTITNKHNGR